MSLLIKFSHFFYFYVQEFCYILVEKIVQMGVMMNIIVIFKLFKKCKAWFRNPPSTSTSSAFANVGQHFSKTRWKFTWRPRLTSAGLPPLSKNESQGKLVFQSRAKSFFHPTICWPRESSTLSLTSSLWLWLEWRITVRLGGFHLGQRENWCCLFGLVVTSWLLLKIVRKKCRWWRGYHWWWTKSKGEKKRFRGGRRKKAVAYSVRKTVFSNSFLLFLAPQTQTLIRESTHPRNALK